MTGPGRTPLSTAETKPELPAASLTSILRQTDAAECNTEYEIRLPGKSASKIPFFRVLGMILPENSEPARLPRKQPVSWQSAGAWRVAHFQISPPPGYSPSPDLSGCHP